ncbi:hypothetical protein [Pleionea mediterranea]|uniref:Uncharacterized protein n=1 Tax=Pleionea mediterranea TaxID=523701 RepID=A0A316F539_9GAMM|nr:hypothetical protein [Pleionea mediterranea]PWK40771.1 hypothetical protein C8D97_1253 [Pleionea mediterranea]
MIGLLFIFVYALFILVAVFMPFLIFRKRAKNYKKKRAILSLIIISIPFFVYAFERTLYEWECSKNVYFYPENKLERPSSIVYSGFIPEGSRAYEKINEKYLLRIFSNFSFEYIVDVGVGEDFKSIGKDRIGELLIDGKLYPYEHRDVANHERDMVINNTKHIVYYSIDYKFNMILITYYIYNYKSDKVISAVSEVSHSKRQDLVNVLYPYEFGVCSKLEAKYGPATELLSNTFK